MTADYLIAGSGLTGATIARRLADAGRDVLVMERRAHLGGNVHDFEHPSGIRVHTFGPHYFRTNSKRIWDFVRRFGEFYEFRARLQSWVDGRYEDWPVTKGYLQSHFGSSWKPARTGPANDFEEACLSMMPALVYEKFVRGYTEKQWGVPARSLAKELAGRFDVRADGYQFLSRHEYQGIPAGGYATFMSRMLDGIPRMLDCDYLREPKPAAYRKLLIFTGPIDEFFGFELGRLKYRGQKRVHEYHPDRSEFQPVGQVNNPDPDCGPFIRTLEWRHMMPAEEVRLAKGTILTREYPYTPGDPDQYEYPFPDAANSELYSRYRDRASSLTDTLICGRLGEYRYYDMDQAIGRALMLADRIIGPPVA